MTNGDSGLLDESPEGLDGQVARFVAESQRVRLERLSRNTTLFGDLGIDGDDGVELIHTFSTAFNVNMSAFDSRRYFGVEAGATPLSLLAGLLSWARDRGATPEERAGLEPITIGDLVRAAEAGVWPMCQEGGR